MKLETDQNSATPHWRRERCKALQALSAAVVVVAALPAPTWALDYSWQGGTGYWDDPAKWSLLGVPGSQDSASIPNNTGTGTVLIRNPASVAQLYLNGGNLASVSSLEVAELYFGSGYFGRSNAQGGGVMNVSGNARFNGSFQQSIAYSHIINLSGNAEWTAGDGRLTVDPAYWQGQQYFSSAALNIGGTASFLDAGAASRTSYKVLGGGAVNNYGAYIRSGLGTSIASGFNNVGRLSVVGGDFSLDGSHFANQSSGSIDVAAGSTLHLHNTTLSGGQLTNLGLVRQFGGEVVVASTAQIGGAWQVDRGVLRIQGAHRVDSLTFNGDTLTGSGVLNAGSLHFNGGQFGGPSAQGGNTVNVEGAAHFSGQGVLSLQGNHQLNLFGNSRWSAGAGRLVTTGASSDGQLASVLHIAAGSNFVDEGAGSAGSFKTLGGGGLVINEGSYRREGAGETFASGFLNRGLLQLAAGVWSVDGRFVNSGRVELAAGTLLKTYDWAFTNEGVMTGDGVLKSFDAQHSLLNRGMLDPGVGLAAGVLTIDGDLRMSDSAVLHVDLLGGGVSDRLVVTDDALWSGELDVSVLQGADLRVGDSYTIASFGSRLGGSGFKSISWHGVSANQFTVDYGANSIVLRVVAVPEPSSPALWALGFALLGLRRLSRRRLSSDPLN